MLKERVRDNITEYLFEYITNYSKGIPNYSRKWMSLGDAIASKDPVIQEQVSELLQLLLH